MMVEQIPSEQVQEGKFQVKESLCSRCRKPVQIQCEDGKQKMECPYSHVKTSITGEKRYRNHERTCYAAMSLDDYRHQCGMMRLRKSN